MKKFHHLLLLLLLTCFCFSGCNATQKQESAGASQIAVAVMNSMTLPEMVELTGKDLTAHYQVDLETLADYSAYTSNTEGSFADVAVFEAKTQEAVSQIVAAVEQRVKEKTEIYQNTNSVQLEKLKKRVLTTHEQFVLYAVGDSTGNAEKIFLEMAQ